MPQIWKFISMNLIIYKNMISNLHFKTTPKLVVYSVKIVNAEIIEVQENI